MSAFFLKIINMSISASWLVLAVLLLRLVLKRAPKWVSVLLWAFVAIRLICPFSFESVLSLIPSAETISPEIMTDATPEIHTGIDGLNSVINPIVSQSFAPDPRTSMNPLQLWIPLAALVWVAGIAGMLIYTAVSYIRLRCKVSAAVRLRNNIYQSENADSPFVLGIVRPKIYLPFRMDGDSLEHVIAHEEAHIRRKDHWWKPLGFLLLALHWFNPLMWLAYILLCRDIELACDEKVISQMDHESKADYTQTLVSCSVNRRRIAACPLAFGEVGVKERVKSVMNYKKPTFWIILAAIVICAVVAVCFLTNPMDRVSLTKLSKDEAHLPGILSNVEQMTVTYNGMSVSCTGEAEKNRFLATLEKIEVSKDPISLNRSEDRSRAFTIQVNGNTELHFNERFTEFWVDNNVKPSLTHRITNPETAKELLLDFDFTYIPPVEGSSGGEKSYVAGTRAMTLADVVELSKLGVALTWEDLSQFQGRDVGSGLYVVHYDIDPEFYLVVGDSKITGKPMYVNLNAKSTGSSCEVRDSDVEAFIKENKHEALDYVIYKAIITQNGDGRFPEYPTGMIPTESHYILGVETKSGTPLSGGLNHMEETTVYVEYVYRRYTYTEGELVSVAGCATPAKITFSVDPETGYTVKEFWEPNGGSAFAEDIRKAFPKEIADMVLDPQSEVMNTEELETQCREKVENYLAGLKNQEE